MRSSRNLQRACLLLSAVMVLAVGVAGPARAQSADGLPVPSGQIIIGPVYRGTAFNGYLCPGGVPCPGTSVPSIATGLNANNYLLPKYTDPAFVPNAPAVVALTTAPTQYVRFYNPAAGSNQIGGFLVGSNAVRGLTPAQIQNVLALSFTPTMETIVQLPAGTCLLIGPTNPLYGQQGGAVQEFLIGKSQGGAGCGPVPQFIPTSSYINGQPIGAYALAYAPRAGGGNTGAVASALDHATPPPLFSDMDGVYNALDVLNFGDPTPLRLALAQLDGEIYADLPSVTIGVGQMFLDALHDQTHLARSFTGPLANGVFRPWVSSFGGGGALFGNGNTHGIGFGGGGITAGADYRFTPDLQAGIAAAYLHSAFNTSAFAGSGGLDSFAVGSYAGYAAGLWYIDGALGYSYNSAGVNRSIDFPGVTRAAVANPVANAFLSNAETGYHFLLDDRTKATPFASFEGIVAEQNSFAEGGAGAINLNVNSHNAALALSTLGLELTYDLPLGLAAPLGFSARAGWAHDFADVNRSITASLQGTPDASFTVNGARWPQNAAAVGARFSLPLQAVNLFVRYDGVLASNASIHTATAGLVIDF
ncbi:MAG TPA: autotransporter outer membrane beta-barrel domain-containing protein [Methylocella sp.]|nr:autotransporter outer membrane beta-barrel domain-containing protein [Methylocella sp.]